MANKMVIVDGVRYELSPADWNLQQQILSRARVVKDDKASQVKHVAEPVVAKKESAPREQQPDDVVKGFIGHTNVVYYNWKTNKWNTNKYNGCLIEYIDRGMFEKFKAEMENIPEFGRHYELLTPVIMATEFEWGFGELRPRPGAQYSEFGDDAVGNIIVRDKATGKLKLYWRSWLHIVGGNKTRAASRGMYSFVKEGAYFSRYRDKIIEAHTR